MRRLFTTSLYSLCTLCLCGESVFADPPVGMYLFPAGGQKGTTVKFHASGLYLNQSCSLEMIGAGVKASPIVRATSSLWFEGPMLALPESQRQEDYPRAMAGSVTIAADSPLGHRYVLLRTAQGITLPQRFVVGELPEMVEEELPGSPVPVQVKTPLTINGRIFPHEDIDVWSVSLKKGQVLSIWVEADRIGSPLEAKIDVRDSTGKLVAESVATTGTDPRTSFTALADGAYQISITDARSDGGPAYVYRLNLSTDTVVERAFPLGGQRGSRIALEYNGTRSATVAMPADAKGTHLARIAAGVESSLPFALDVDEFPEVREQDSPDPVRGNFLAIPSIGNGRIASPGEVDRWGFSARKGDALEFELRANRLGSPLLGVLTITDSAGKELAKAEPTTGDPSLKFTAPADGLYFANVQDRFRGRGGNSFAYRLRLARPAPDFDLTFAIPSLSVTRGQQAILKIAARRHGTFNGPISIHLDGLPAGLSLPKEIVLAAGQLAIDVPIKADASAKIDGSLLGVRGTGLISLAPFTAMFCPITKSATWADDATVDRVRLAVAVPTPFKIAGDYELRLIPRGTVYTRKYRIERNGFAGPIEIDLAEKQARHLQGVTGPKFIVPGDKNEFEYPITLPSWMDAGRTCRVCVMGTGTVKDADGTAHVITYSSREQNDQIIAVVEPERLGMRIERGTVLAQPGSTVELKIEVRRGEGLKGAANVEVIVPRGIKGVSAAVLRVDGENGTLKVQFEKDAKGPFPMPLTIRTTVMDGDKPVTAERALELVVPKP